MKSVLLVLLLSFKLVSYAQEIPTKVINSFNKQFPDTEIESWKDNNTYDPAGLDEDGRDSTSEDAKKRGLKDPQDPTEFYIYFRKDGINWCSQFKIDGSFVIAHGRVDTLPKNVTDAINKAFEGQKIKIGNDIQKVIVPSSITPIYRVFVYVKHNKKHIVKVNENGNIYSNTME